MHYTHLYGGTAKKVLVFLFYLAILAATTMRITPLRQIPFLLFAAFIFFALWGPLHCFREEEAHTENGKTKKIFLFLAFASLAFFLISRLLPFIHYGEAPLGYDTGTYLQYFSLITTTGVIEESVGSALAYALWFPFYYMGASGIVTIHVLHIFNQLLTLGAFFFFIRSLFPKNTSLPIAATALFLFALSINQFMTYWWMLYKQSAAIPFLLMALGFFLRGSWLAVIFAILGAMIHLPTAFPFAVALVLFFIASLTVKIIKGEPIGRMLLMLLLGGGIAALTAFALLPDEFSTAFAHLKRLRGFATNAAPWSVQQMKGLFISLWIFKTNTMFYAPFALMGLLTFRSWLPQRKDMRELYLILLASTLLVLVSFPFIYQLRFLMTLDMLMLAFAAVPVTLFIKKFLTDQLGKIVIALFAMGTLVFSAYFVWNRGPQLYPDERKELRALQEIIKPDDYAMATDSIYTPWVFAFTGLHKTIAPGWLYWDKWDLERWTEFWVGTDNERRHELLRMYGNNDLYLFVGWRQMLHPNLRNFIDTDTHFIKISPHIWRYTPYLPGKEALPEST